MGHRAPGFSWRYNGVSASTTVCAAYNVWPGKKHILDEPLMGYSESQRHSKSAWELIRAHTAAREQVFVNARLEAIWPGPSPLFRYCHCCRPTPVRRWRWQVWTCPLTAGAWRRIL